MLKHSPLDAQHRALGAKMGAFGGWDMPISYAGTVSEHEDVRARAGLFDVSHLGKFAVRGPGAAAFLDTMFTNRMADLQPGQARYTLFCNEQGGIIDDIIVYALGADDLLVVPNASNRDRVFEPLRAAAPDGIEVAVLEWTTLAVQGPAALNIVGARYPVAADLGYMHVARAGDIVLARSGYTGERGFEVFTTAADAVDAWDGLLAGVRDAGGHACGLAARDTLRLEMGYPLHGNDIGPDVTPAEAGSMWAVKLEGRSFPGADAIRERTPRTSLVGLRMLDRLIPRAHQAVLDGDEQVGECTSGTFSPTLKVGIALAAVRLDHAALGTELEVDVRGKRGRAQVVKPPFVDRSPR